MTEVTLKPCPFCQGEAEISFYAHAGSPEPKGRFVECMSCAAAGPSFETQGDAPDRDEYTQAQAIAAWNTRAEASSAEPVADLAGYERGQRETVAQIVAWLRKPLTLIRGISMDQNERLSDAIEAGDWK